MKKFMLAHVRDADLKLFLGHGQAEAHHRSRPGRR